MNRVREAAAPLVDAHRRSSVTLDEASPPSLLADALEQVFAVFDPLDRQHGPDAPLHQDCPAFFDEALQQSEKPFYGDAVREVVRQHHCRWNRRH